MSKLGLVRFNDIGNRISDQNPTSEKAVLMTQLILESHSEVFKIWSNLPLILRTRLKECLYVGSLSKTQQSESQQRITLT